MWICSDCGKKLTNQSVYFVKDVTETKKGVSINKKPICKKCRRQENE